MADSKAVDLSSPTARKRLRSKANRAPYYKSLGEGRFLGYRKGAAGPGTWTARAYAGGKRYKEEVLGTADDVSPADGTVILEYRQAMDAALAWCRTALEPQPEESAGAGWTLGRAMSAYLEWFKAHRKGYASARTVIETHVLRSFGRDTVVAPVYCPSAAPYPFSAAGIRRWHQELAAAPARFRPGKERQKTRPAPAAADEVRARKATANRVLTYLRAALNFNVAEGKIPKAAESIWTSVRPFRKVDKPRIRFFDAEETSRLLNVCDPDFKHLVTGALLTGGRYGGLTAMLVRDFNEESGFVQLTEKAEGDEPRTVFLNEEGIRFFSSLSAGREPNEIMFLRSDGSPWKRSHQTRPMAEAAKAAHLAPPNNFHILRHTYASLYLMGGGSLEGLARQLGHADTRMTIRSYAHLAERWRAKEARASAPRFGIEAPTNVRSFKAV